MSDRIDTILYHVNGYFHGAAAQFHALQPGLAMLGPQTPLAHCRQIMAACRNLRNLSQSGIDSMPSPNLILNCAKAAANDFHKWETIKLQCPTLTVDQYVQNTKDVFQTMMDSFSQYNALARKYEVCARAYCYRHVWLRRQASISGLIRFNEADLRLARLSLAGAIFCLIGAGWSMFRRHFGLSWHDLTWEIGTGVFLVFTSFLSSLIFSSLIFSVSVRIRDRCKVAKVLLDKNFRTSKLQQQLYKIDAR